MNKKIQNDQHCFCCGKENDRGLKLEFSYPEEGAAKTSLVVPAYFTGWENLTHGGLISMLLDETMAHACINSKLIGVTAELTVRFKKPLPVSTEIFVTGTMTDNKGRIALTSGEISDASGTVYATAKARFISTN
ncbi:MAG: PaaI family thioesterase [Spirochaetaceae bacterium]|nr:PaaI family thioesterase [Spirochaetaceae bacterium]